MNMYLYAPRYVTERQRIPLSTGALQAELDPYLQNFHIPCRSTSILPKKEVEVVGTKIAIGSSYVPGGEDYQSHLIRCGSMQHPIAEIFRWHRQVPRFAALEGYLVTAT
jgi:hypothetical protein